MIAGRQLQLQLVVVTRVGGKAVEELHGAIEQQPPRFGGARHGAQRIVHVEEQRA